MEGSTQWQCPGSCHHTRNYSSLRQKDSAKHSRFIEGIVALKKGGGAGKLREQAALMDSGERFLSALCKRRECGWLAASEAVGRRYQQHSSLQSLLSRRWHCDLVGGVASKLRCRPTWLPTLAETAFHLSQPFLTPGDWEAGAMSWGASI